MYSYRVLLESNTEIDFNLNDEGVVDGNVRIFDHNTGYEYIATFDAGIMIDKCYEIKGKKTVVHDILRGKEVSYSILH
jgi:hypothetical protein